MSKEGHEIHLFFHGRKYAGENFADLLEKRSPGLDPPIQMKDALSQNKPGKWKVKEAFCNSHAYRQFKDIRHLYPQECDQIMELYGPVAKSESKGKLDHLNDEERLKFHKKEHFPVMESLKKTMEKWVKDKKVEPNSSLGKAVNYFLKYYAGLTAFCTIVGAPVDNNKEERSLKKIIRLRKTSMFYKTEKSAGKGAKLQSLLVTAESCGCNPLEYLMILLENPTCVEKSPEDWFPWNYKERLTQEMSLASDNLAPEEASEKIPEGFLSGMLRRLFVYPRSLSQKPAFA